MVRGIVSVAAGLLAAAVFFQVSAALILLTTVGIPLGAESRSITFGELLGYLAVGVAAALVGGWVTGRVTGPRLIYGLSCCLPSSSAQPSISDSPSQHHNGRIGGP